MSCKFWETDSHCSIRKQRFLWFWIPKYCDPTDQENCDFLNKIKEDKKKVTKSSAKKAAKDVFTESEIKKATKSIEAVVKRRKKNEKNISNS
jgi:hypothetical protein